MACGNTSQLINVFRKTPHVPFRYIHSSTYQLYTPATIQWGSSASPFLLWQSSTSSYKLMSLLSFFLSPPSLPDKYPHHGTCTREEQTLVLYVASYHVAERIIMMANYAISKGLCLASLSHETDDRNQFSDRTNP